eukprot:9273519-Pyramimonas_sp.AAC.1
MWPARPPTGSSCPARGHPQTTSRRARAGSIPIPSRLLVETYIATHCIPLRPADYLHVEGGKQKHSRVALDDDAHARRALGPMIPLQHVYCSRMLIKGREALTSSSRRRRARPAAPGARLPPGRASAPAARGPRGPGPTPSPGPRSAGAASTTATAPTSQSV